MTKARKLVIVSIVMIIALAAIGLYLWWPSSHLRLDALATGAKQAVLDVDHEYATARNFKPAYHGYAIHGDFAFEEVQSRIGDVGVSILKMDQIHAVDWRKEQDNMGGWGPQYVYRRNDTGQDVLVMKVTLIRCWRYNATVQIDHDGGGAVYTLSRWPGQPWRITQAVFRKIPY